MVQLRSCCQCYSLRAGTIFAGICGIVLSIISLILIFTLKNIKWSTILITAIDQDTVKIIYALNLVMTILISLVMIIGVLKRNTYMILPWVVLGFILIISLFISIIYTGIMFIIDHYFFHAFLWFVGGAVVIVVYCYFWLVVYSYYQQLKMEELDGKIDPYGRPYNYRRP